MKTTAFTALLLAVSANLVSAAPADKESTGRVSYTGASRDAQPKSGDWVELASATPASHGREFITVDPHTGPYVQLRIDAASGRPVVESVVIYYADGSKRTVRVDRELGTKKSRSATVDLKGPKLIDQLVVVTVRSSKGTYVVMAEPEEPINVARK